MMKTVVLYVRERTTKEPQLRPEIHFSKIVFKDVRKFWESFETNLTRTNDDSAYFDGTNKPRAILQKHLPRSSSDTTLVTLLDKIDPEKSKLLPARAGLTKLRKNLNNLPGILSSLDRKKALILLKVFNLSDLQDTNKTEEIATVLNDLKIIDPKRKERIIADTLGLAQRENEGDAKPASSYMTDEYIGLLQGLKLDKTEIERIANTHENKTLDEWSTYLTKRLTLEKESKNHRAISEIRKTLPGATNGTNNNGTHTATDKPVVASPIITEPLIIEDNPDLIITAPCEPDLVISAEPLVINNLDQLILKNYERFIKLLFPNYDTFLEKLLHELKETRILDSSLTMPDFKSQLEERFGLNEDYYSERVKALSAVTRTNGHIQSNGFTKETELTLVAPKSLIDSLTDKDTGETNPRGHVLSIRSNIPEVRIVNEADSKTMVIDNSVSNRDLHQIKLNQALSLFNGGSLVICGSQALKNGPIKVETVNNSIGLICIHSKANDRIWGEYNVKTGELVFLGIAKSHKNRIWKDLIHAYEQRKPI